MNVNKFIATLIVKNHNNGIFNAQDAFLRDKIYHRVSAAIELAKQYQLDIDALDDRFIVRHAPQFDNNTFKPITIYKKHVHCGEVADFFFGLRRSSNPVGFVSYYKHINEDKFLYLIECNGSVGAGVCSKSQKKNVAGNAQFHQLNEAN